MGAKKEGNAALVIVGIVCVLGGVVLWLSRSQAEGVLTFRADAGASTFVGEDCESGEHEGFFGVQVEAKDGAHLRVVREPDGNVRLLRAPPGATTFAPALEDRGACQRFDVDVRQKGGRVDNVIGMALDLSIDCPGVQGTLKARDCH